MAALLKELLFDIVDNKVVHHDTARLIESGHSIAWEYLPSWEDQCIARCDVSTALKHLFNTDQVDWRDILSLRLLLSGRRVAEIPIEDARERLVRVLMLLEQATQYTDDKFLERVVTKYPKYSKTKEAYREKLIESGKSFT